MATYSATQRSDGHWCRHELMSSVTVISAQTELLQRQMLRMPALTAGDRQYLNQGLTAILAASRSLASGVRRLPAIDGDGRK